MDEDILELYPDPGRKHRLNGLYLNQSLAPAAGRAPFIYSNFISSLDGRIAMPGPDRQTHQVPPAIANARDWRLFQELAAHADLIITSARYFRQIRDHEAQAELPVGRATEFDDLRAWRETRGLAAQPDIAIFSASLDIPPAALAPYRDRRLFLITGAGADPEKLAALQAGIPLEVITCGTQASVDASTLRTRLAALGYQRVYAIAGPSVLHALAQGGALDQLYHTTAHCLLGGTRFDTFVHGTPLQPAFCMPLRAMYLDTRVPEGAGQTLAVYGHRE
ncbi:MAG TPA: pyrimidine reductase [Gammaproteobacteria bacterium]|nr:pyrimidine reductase [Gammaproteobacteria bacterium]